MSELKKIISDAIGMEPIETEESDSVFKVEVAKEKAVDTIPKLKDIGFSYLTMLTAVCREDDFDVVYMLDNWKHKSRIWIYTRILKASPNIQSLTPHWVAADWLEREVYDMYGIEFEDHPNMTRILTPFDFTKFPLRKDFKETD